MSLQVELLHRYITSYRSFLNKLSRHPEWHKWDVLVHFQRHWNIDAIDFAEMYNRSLDSSHSRRWWKTPSFNPKEVMLRLIEEQPDLMRQAFKDLLYGQGEAVDRMDRFVFYCDEALQAFKKSHPNSIVNHHYHSSNHMCSLYLSLAHPDTYGPYFHECFLSFLREMKSRKLPENRDPERYFTLCTTLNKLLIEAEGVSEAFNNFLHQNNARLDDCEHPFLAQDFIHFTANHWDEPGQ